MLDNALDTGFLARPAGRLSRRRVGKKVGKAAAHLLLDSPVLAVCFVEYYGPGPRPV